MRKATILIFVIALSSAAVFAQDELAQYQIWMKAGASANGALKTGIHYHSQSSENACTVMLTLLRTMGVHAATWGVGPGMVKDGLSAITV